MADALHDLRKVLVIGATSGIGRALTEALRGRGVPTVAAGRRKDLLDALGGETLVLDATAPDLAERLTDVGADAVFYNAGYGERTPMPDPERTERAVAVNVLGFERAAQWALTHARLFVATASIAGLRGLEDTNGYSASKAYMINAMEGYRRKARHGRFPCRYVTLLPGFVDTAMGQASAVWRCSPKAAAFAILKTVKSGRAVGYVTPRWRLVAWLLKLMPRALFERIPLP